MDAATKEEEICPPHLTDQDRLMLSIGGGGVSGSFDVAGFVGV